VTQAPGGLQRHSNQLGNILFEFGNQDGSFGQKAKRRLTKKRLGASLHIPSFHNFAQALVQMRVQESESVSLKRRLAQQNKI
jgi:hypothetical protein